MLPLLKLLQDGRFHSGGALLFHLISQCYEKTSLIISANLSFGE
ncbi:hypothetical protein SAMN05216603_1372 [Pseudomonas benzenivorans]|nr:hypothetical protein SAMN05216603_1372 [Pseudomonas benzenivorans]